MVQEHAVDLQIRVILRERAFPRDVSGQRSATPEVYALGYAEDLANWATLCGYQKHVVRRPWPDLWMLSMAV